MKIEVTQVHINEGIPCSIVNCPVAKAIRAKPETGHAFVGDMDVMIGGKYIPLPQAVRRRIKRFDVGKQIRPFTFELELNAAPAS